MFCLKCGTELKKKGKILTCPSCKTAYTAETEDGKETLTEYIAPRGFSSKKPIMFVILGAVLAVVIAIVGITTGVSVSRSQSVAHGFEIAERYLSELNYEQAVIEFQNILEIEPMNVDAYLGLAKAYVGMGDTEKALETLHKGYEHTGDERLQDMIDELERADEPPVSSSGSSSASSSSETSEPEPVINLEDFVIVDGVLTEYKGSGGDVIIPDGITTIGDGAFSCCDFTSVTIPDSVTTIGDDAFYECTSLTRVTIADSVTKIGSRSFYGCTSLTNATYKGKTYSYENIKDLYKAINGY